MKANVTYKCSKYLLVDHFGVEGKGTSITEATQDAGEKIRAMANADYRPFVLSFVDGQGRDTIFVVSCDAGDYGYTILRDGEHEGWANTCGVGTREECIMQARHHAAQSIFDPFTRDCLPACYAILEPEQVYQFARDAEWQYLVRHYIDVCRIDSEQARREANSVRWGKDYPEGFAPVPEAVSPTAYIDSIEAATRDARND